MDLSSYYSSSFGRIQCLCLWFVAGRVAEFDTPARLLEDKSSMFLKLVTEYSSRSTGIPEL